jgi:hypothetical protein
LPLISKREEVAIIIFAPVKLCKAYADEKFKKDNGCAGVSARYGGL